MQAFQEDVLGVSQLSLDEMVNTFYFHRIDTFRSFMLLSEILRI